MEIKQLQSYCAVVKYRSFTKAAEKLFISQPTISNHIKQLENELDVSLIIRTTKSIEITKRGEELYRCAQNIVELQGDLMNRWQHEDIRMINIGASTIPSAYILPALMPEFRSKHPEVVFHVHQSDSQAIIRELLHGRYSIGFVGYRSSDKELEFISLIEDEMVLITPNNDKYASKKDTNSMTLSDIKNEPILIREKGSGSKKCIEQYFDDMDIDEDKLHIVARLNDQESIKNLVSAGLGISIISGMAAKDYEEDKKILTFKLPGKSAKRALYLVYRKDDRESDTTSEFIRFATKYYER